MKKRTPLAHTSIFGLIFKVYNWLGPCTGSVALRSGMSPWQVRLSSLPLYYVLWTFSLYFYFILLFCVLLIGRFFYCCVPVQHFFQYQWPHWQGRNSYSVCLNSNNNNLRQQCLVYCVTLTNSILQENFFPFFTVRKVTFWDSTFCISAINMLNK